MRNPFRSSLSLLLALAMAAPLPGFSQAAPAAPPARAQGQNQASNQGPPPDETSVFGETVEVRVVNLEVVVTDRSGNRVHDLKPADFRLLIDGKPTSIDYFTEVAEGRAVEVAPAAPEAAAAPAAPAAPATIAGVEPGSEVGTSYVVFVDNLFTILPRDRDLVLRSIIDQLDQLGPADRMAVVAFDGRRPELLSNWSHSRIALRTALERAIERRGRGVQIAAETAHVDAVEAQNPNEAPAEAFGTGPTREDLGLGPANASEVTSYCATVHRIESRVRQEVTGVTATMRSLAGVPGRKVMLLVTGGWPRSPKEFVLGQENPIDIPADCKTRGADLYEPIHQIANRIGFTLYPIVAQEPPSAFGNDTNYASTNPSPAYGDGALDPRSSLRPNAQFRFDQMQETAVHLARETGGKSFAAGTRKAALKTTIDDTRSYYWLGFTPTWKGDDRSHDIKLQVARPGLSVRTRADYLDLSRKAEVSYMVESALLFGNAPGTYPLPIQLGPFPPGKKDKVRVPLKIAIPLQLVTLIEQGGKHVGELELRVAVVNDLGERNDLPVIGIKLGLKQAPQPNQFAPYKVDLEMRRQKQDVVIALFDPPTGRVMEAKATIKP